MRFNLHTLGAIEAFEDNRLTRSELRKAIMIRSQLLSRIGIKPGNLVILLHGNTPSFFADLFAIWWNGACAVCLNPEITNEEILRITNFISPSAILVDEKQTPPTLPGVDVYCLEKESVSQTDLNRHHKHSLDNPSIILFTSGTTGEPKGVTHTFRSILARIVLNQQFVSKEDMARTLCPLPTHFGHGLIGNCLTPLLTGADLLLVKGNKVETISSLSKIIEKHETTFLSSVPAFWKIATKLSSSPSCKSLRRIHVGSAPLSSDLWGTISDWCHTPNVVNMYGITETANWICGASADEHDPSDGLIGKMWGGFAAVLNDEGEIKSEGEGEILIQSPSIMQGYFRREDLTDEVLRDGWFFTGDVGKISKDKLIHLTGRKKYEINRAGIKIHPEDIDLLLERHPSVVEACAFSQPDDIAGEIVGVAVVMDAKSRTEISSVKKWCNERLVNEKIPSRWFVVDNIPKSDRGKVNRDHVAKYCSVKASI